MQLSRVLEDIDVKGAPDRLRLDVEGSKFENSYLFSKFS